MEKDNIVQNGDPVLREKAKEIPVEKIATTAIQSLVEKMQEALDQEKEGVALAAPQIGESLQIFVIAPKAYEIAKKKLGELIFINPKITNTGKDKKTMEEGCLSVRGKFGKTKRYDKLTVEAYDENGNHFERGFSGFLAQIVQHEVDHLNGILFIDHAENVDDIDNSEVNEL